MMRLIRFLVFFLAPIFCFAAEPLTTKNIADNVSHGLVVILGDSPENTIRLAEGLCAQERYRVQCLSADSDELETLRAEIGKRHLSGKISVRKLTSRYLPYSNNMVNGLIIGNGDHSLLSSELERVVTPDGVVLLDTQIAGKWDLAKLDVAATDISGWKKLIKTRSNELDSWTHFGYDATGSMLSKDKQVGAPRHLQWLADPKFTRSHENMTSITAVVSAGGKIFSIIDEGPTASIYLPPRVSLVARDAFNGILLWKQPIANWFNPLYRLKSGPHQLARRLVAVGDTVYITLGIDAPVSVIDAVSGNVKKTLLGTENTSEILYIDNTLILLVHDQDKALSSILAYDLKSDSTLWKNTPQPWAHSTLTTNGKQVFCYANGNVRCMDVNTGKPLWQQKVFDAKTRFALNQGPGLIIHKDVLIFASRSNMAALNAATGKPLWQKKATISDYASPTRVHIVNDIVWTAGHKGWPRNGGVSKGTENEIFKGYHFRTGELKQTIGVDPKAVGIIHHRCYPPKAVDKYLLTSWPGIEFIDTTNQSIKAHNWIRGTCLYGIMPANGLIYTPPNPCVCYNQGREYGYKAVSPMKGNILPTPTAAQRLEKGPAYAKATAGKPTTNSDWPTFRGDGLRSGYTSTTLTKKPAIKWQVKLGSNLTPAICAEQKIYLADKDSHFIYALDAETGKTAWRYSTDGAVDSPPTYFRGNLYFGCRDGYVYCLNAADGSLRWRFMAAMKNRQIISCDALESQWPIHGSVTITNDKLYFVAGRNPFMDQGMDLYCLDPLTGQQTAVKRIFSLNKNNEQPPLTGTHVVALSMDTVGPDILSTDGKHLFLRHKTIDVSDDLRIMSEAEGIPHLYAAMGFLDDNFFHRAYWVYDSGTVNSRYAWIFGKGGAARRGKPSPGKGKSTSKNTLFQQQFGSHLSVLDDTGIYHFGQKKFAMAHPKKSNNPRYFLTATARSNDRKIQPWSVPTDVWVRAMMVTADCLYIAGASDNWHTDQEAFDGKTAVLRTINKNNGKQLGEVALNAAPVFNGIAGANGKLYISLSDGTIACLEAANAANGVES